MQSADAQPLLFQWLLNWLISRGKANRVPLLSALFFGMLAHAFAFTNKLVNHDEVNSLFSKGATVESGRWGLGFLDCMFPNVSMPWIYGMITIGLLAVSVCILVQIFSLRSKWTQVLAAGFVLTFPSLTGTFGYMFTSSSYAVAFLLAVLTVCFLVQPSRWNWLLALGCMVLSLSIYQSYVSITAALLILVLIQLLLEGVPPLTILRRGVAFVVFLALALGLYFAATLVVLKLKHVSMGTYASENIVFSPLTLVSNAALAYKSFFLSFREGAQGLIPSALSRSAHVLLLICAAVLLVIRLGKVEKNPLSWLLLAVLIALLPLAINCMYLFTSAQSIHTLVLYSFICVYLLILMLADGCMGATVPKWTDLCRRAALNSVAVLSAIILAVNIYISNQAYLTLHLRYENAYGFFSSLIADIKMMPEFTEGTQLAIIGTWEDPEFYADNLDFTNYLTGVTGFKPDNYSQDAFLRYYLGFSIPFASAEKQAEIAASPEYAEMAVYPYYGSLRKIDSVLVVKLSQ